MLDHDGAAASEQLGGPTAQTPPEPTSDSLTLPSEQGEAVADEVPPVALPSPDDAAADSAAVDPAAAGTLPPDEPPADEPPANEPPAKDAPAHADAGATSGDSASPDRASTDAASTDAASTDAASTDAAATAEATPAEPPAPVESADAAVGEAAPAEADPAPGPAPGQGSDDSAPAGAFAADAAPAERRPPAPTPARSRVTPGMLAGLRHPGRPARPAPTEFGRIDDDGTVWVKTDDGERAIGSWLTGDMTEGLAYYERRFADLEAEVAILEHRVATDPKAAAAAAKKLQPTLATATVVGDIASLRQRLQVVIDAASAARQAEHEARQQKAAALLAAKKALADEAEKLAGSKNWKATGDRFRTLIAEWKALGVPERPGDRAAEQQHWQRIASAREQFTQRRSGHFAELDEQRKGAQLRKEKLVTEAEKLVSSTDWATTAKRLKDLQAQWKAVGRAPRDVEDAMWQRFRAATDAFFAARSAAFSERDAEFRGNQALKEKLCAEAEALAAGLKPGSDVAAASRRLRDLQDRWEKAGKVPREAMGPLERRMQAVEEKVRAASQSRWRSTNVDASPLVIRLRESVAKLEGKIDRARAAGRESEMREAEATLATQREWLARAERG